MSASTRTTFKSSELSRDSASVFAAASDHPIHVTRRDGETLVLMTEREDTARTELLQLAAQLIGAATVADGDLTGYMVERFPWMRALPAEDQSECALDVLNAARASFSVGQAHLALATLTSWQETATALAAGLGQQPVTWLDTDEPIARP